MLRAFIKYKNENNERVLTNLKISKDLVKDYNYSIDNKSAILYGENDNGIVYLENYSYPMIKYLFSDSDVKEIDEKNYDILPRGYKVGDIVLIKRRFGKQHTVAPLETLDEIAKNNNTTVECIIKENNLKTSKLFIGQKLWL